MSYPERLIPQPNYQIIDFDQINTTSRYLVRHTDVKDLKDDAGDLRLELISTHELYQHLRDFSTNLLGVFELEDIKWAWLKNTPCLGKWIPGSLGMIPTESDVDERSEERGCFFLSVSECHHAKLYTDSSMEGEMEVECKVLHTPVLANFWHCSLRWYCNGEDSESWNKGRMRRVKADLRSFIFDRVQLEEPIFQAVDPIYYSTI